MREYDIASAPPQTLSRIFFPRSSRQIRCSNFFFVSPPCTVSPEEGRLARVRFLHASRGKRRGRPQDQQQQYHEYQQDEERHRPGRKRADAWPLNTCPPFIAPPAAPLGDQRSGSWTARVIRRRRCLKSILMLPRLYHATCQLQEGTYSRASSSHGLTLYLNQQVPILPGVDPPVQRELRQEKAAARRLPTGRHQLHLPLGGGVPKTPSKDIQQPKQPRKQEMLLGCRRGNRWQQGARPRRQGYGLEAKKEEGKKEGMRLEESWSQTSPRRRDCWMGSSKSSKSWRRFSRKSLLYGNGKLGGNGKGKGNSTGENTLVRVILLKRPAIILKRGAGR